MPDALEGMTWDTWKNLPRVQKDKLRDNSQLTAQLVGLEGWRVEVVTTYDEKRRFIVGKSTGWRPIHLEVKTARSLGGDPAEKSYKTIRQIEKVR
jgi:hypothetical protein